MYHYNFILRYYLFHSSLLLITCLHELTVISDKLDLSNPTQSNPISFQNSLEELLVCYYYNFANNLIFSYFSSFKIF